MQTKQISDWWSANLPALEQNDIVIRRVCAVLNFDGAASLQEMVFRGTRQNEVRFCGKDRAQEQKQWFSDA
jgi:hypothetical protein